MKTGKLVVPVIVLCILLLPMAPVAAQGPEGPLVQRVEEKSAAATEDPTGFAAEQATEEQLAADANWTIAYGCYLAYIASEEADQPPPDLEQCRGFEEALGIAPEEPPEQGPVADAEELQDQAIVEAEALAEDLEETAGRIADEPTGAPDEAIGFVARALRAVERILGTIGFVAAAPVLGVASIAQGTVGLGASGASALAAGVVAIGEASRSAGSALAEGTRGTIEGIGSAVESVRDAVRDLFGATPATEGASVDRPDAADRLPDDAAGVREAVEDLVEDTSGRVA